MAQHGHPWMAIALMMRAVISSWDLVEVAMDAGDNIIESAQQFVIEIELAIGQDVYLRSLEEMNPLEPGVESIDFLMLLADALGRRPLATVSDCEWSAIPRYFKPSLWPAWAICSRLAAPSLPGRMAMKGAGQVAMLDQVRAADARPRHRSRRYVRGVRGECNRDPEPDRCLLLPCTECFSRSSRAYSLSLSP